MNIEELRKLNEEKIEELKKNGYTAESEDVNARIQHTIKKILKNDKIFFNMNMNESLKLLKCLVDVDDSELLSMYNDLISPKQFEESNQSASVEDDGR